MKELELYIHIPFCMKKCNYCDFLSASADEKSQFAYMQALERELVFYGQYQKGRIITSIYIGGGTPSWLQEYYIADLMEVVRKYFTVAADAEITIECNPGTLTKAKLLTYRQAGINRLSIGLQSADNAELENLGRVHTYEQFVRNYELARSLGFDNINVDLMNGLPGQTPDKYYQTLAKVIRLAPEHISSYGLIIEKGTVFYDWYKFDQVRQEAGMPTEELPTEDTVYQIEKMAQNFLEENGYHRYEISNYARRGRECRHNIGYWQRMEYLGVGLGAASLLDEVRYANVRDLDTYIAESQDIRLTAADGELRQETCLNLHASAEILSRNAQMEEFMFLGLRMTDGIEKNRFYKTFGFTTDFIYGDVIRFLKEEELIDETPVRLALTDRGLDLANYVMAQFLFDSAESRDN